LPPGPIANPGRAALEAVANPSRTQDLYFVADGTGGHVFAESLEQHNRNVQRWRQIEKDKEKATPDVVGPQTLPVRTDQKGELPSGSEYGALHMPLEIGKRPADAGVSLDMTAVALAITRTAPKMPADAASALPGPADKGKHGKKAKAAPAPEDFARKLGPGLDELGISIAGVTQGRSATATLDGPMSDATQNADPQPDPALIAALAARLAEQRERAAKVAKDPGSTTLPPPSAEDSGAQTASPDPQKVAHAKVIDASEGTPIDPLLDHTYDLNYARTIPTAAALNSTLNSAVK